MVLPGRPKYVLDFCGAKSRDAMCRSKGMAGRGPVSGVDTRSGEDERSEPFYGTWRPERRPLSKFSDTLADAGIITSTCK